MRCSRGMPEGIWWMWRGFVGGIDGVERRRGGI